MFTNADGKYLLEYIKRAMEARSYKFDMIEKRFFPQLADTFRRNAEDWIAKDVATIIVMFRFIAEWEYYIDEQWLCHRATEDEVEEIHSLYSRLQEAIFACQTRYPAWLQRTEEEEDEEEDCDP